MSNRASVVGKASKRVSMAGTKKFTKDDASSLRLAFLAHKQQLKAQERAEIEKLFKAYDASKAGMSQKEKKLMNQAVKDHMATPSTKELKEMKKTVLLNLKLMEMQVKRDENALSAAIHRTGLAKGMMK